ncbi:hypothetical protein GCM10011405_33250 [Rufibacter glacialis]|nr:hypothetical protein GCM10011405_33250 [Rufibacter glacialis]
MTSILKKKGYKANCIIELLKQENKIGTFSIQQDEQVSFVNFDSDSLAFGFRLTYGIGMFINEKR